MSGSDRFLSMSLDDIIKARKQPKNSRGQRGRGQSTNRRGQGRQQQQQQRYQNVSQRGSGQSNRGGRSFRGNRFGQTFQSNIPQGSWRGQSNARRGGFRGRGNRAMTQHQTYPRQQQQQAGAWSSRQNLQNNPRGARARGTARQTRGATRGAASQARGLSLASARQTRGVSRGATRRGWGNRQIPTTRGVSRLRPRGPLPTRPPQTPQARNFTMQSLRAAQIAKNRVRLAAQILVRRKQQLQSLQGPSLRIPQTRMRGSFSTRGMRGARRGALLNRLATRATMAQKLARAADNRARQGQILSVRIQNERASFPQMLVLNSPPLPPPRPPPMIALSRPPVFSRPQPQAYVYEEQEVEEEMVTPMPSVPGRRLTLHERFSH